MLLEHTPSHKCHHWHFYVLHLRPGYPNPNGFRIADSPVFFQPAVESIHPHRNTLNPICFGGGGGIRTRVQQTYYNTINEFSYLYVEVNSTPLTISL